MALCDLGFGREQEAVYRALLDEPTAEPTKLARLVGTTEHAVVPALTALVDLGVARADGARPAGIALLNPAVAVAGLIERVEGDLLRRHRSVSDTRTELPELSSRYKRAPVPDRAGTDIERLDGGDAFAEAMAELSFFTRTSVYTVQPDGPQTSAILESQRPLDLRALRRGVSLRVLCDKAVLAKEGARSYAREMAAAGAQFRVAKHSLDPMIIMDERVVVIPTDPQDSGQGALVVRQPSLLTGFVRLYHRLWEDAETVGWELDEEPVEAPLVDADRKLLELLASGVTDEAAARVVGFSVRHVRRRIAALMERLGAASRFEAGVAAAHRGWI